MDLLQPIANRLPSWLKIDGTAQAFVLWWYMSNYTGLTNQEMMYIVGINAGVHGLLHDTACRLQSD